ncbi:MAG: phosphoserine phosphatase SerB [Rhodospirillaceae bacterium]|nr:phosphoserine phosphatase SerB [Rhodospirillaceae bacterium]
MDKVLTLIAGGAGGLDDGIVAAAGAALQRVGAGPGAPQWLADGLACDLPFAGSDPRVAARAVQAGLAGQAVDAVAQPVQGRRKALLVADMDMTVITHETLDEIAAEAGVGDTVAAITRRAMNGEIDFAEALHERVALLRGHPAALLDRVLDRTQLTPGARSLVATMRAGGATCILVSGGFTHFTAPVAAAAGFQAAEGNQLEIAGGRLTGRVVGPVVDKHRKVAALHDWTSRLGLERGQTLAVGDGANDLPMLLEAGLGVAFHAKPVVRDQAPARIDHGDLSALLYLQGYRRDEILPD